MWPARQRTGCNVMLGRAVMAGCVTQPAAILPRTGQQITAQGKRYSAPPWVHRPTIDTALKERENGPPQAFLPPFQGGFRVGRGIPRAAGHTLALGCVLLPLSGRTPTRCRPIARRKCPAPRMMGRHSSGLHVGLLWIESLTMLARMYSSRDMN